MRRRLTSKAARGLETRRIVYGDHRRPHDKPQQLKVDVRRGEVIDEDYAAAMVAVRTTLPLADVRIIKITPDLDRSPVEQQRSPDCPFLLPQFPVAGRTSLGGWPGPPDERGSAVVDPGLPHDHNW